MRRPVHVQGHDQPLHVIAWSSSCGDIVGNGVAFEFGNSGSWVISLAELEAVVAEAKAAQDELAVLRSFIPKDPA